MPIIEILIISACSFWFAELSTIPQTVTGWLDFNRLLPFDCSKCMGFWTGYVYLVLNISETVFYLPILTSLFAIIFSRLYYKFLS